MKHAQIVPLKDKKSITIANAFLHVLDKSNRKSNKIWADNSSELYNNSFKKWFKGNNIEIY